MGIVYSNACVKPFNAAGYTGDLDTDVTEVIDVSFPWTNISKLNCLAQHMGNSN